MPSRLLRRFLHLQTRTDSLTPFMLDEEAGTYSFNFSHGLGKQPKSYGLWKEKRNSLLDAIYAAEKDFGLHVDVEPPRKNDLAGYFMCTVGLKGPALKVLVRTVGLKGPALKVLVRKEPTAEPRSRKGDVIIKVPPELRDAEEVREFVCEARERLSLLNEMRGRTKKRLGTGFGG